MKWMSLSWLALCVVAGCSSESDGPPGDVHSAVDGDRDGVVQGADAPANVRLTPSNLPADICDTPGLTDLNAPADTFTDFDTSAPCDALVSQADGLPAICVRKFANVIVAGKLNLGALPNGNPALAIVATHAMTIDADGFVNAQGPDGSGVGWGVENRSTGEAPGAPDARGDGGQPPDRNGSGAGHVTHGAGTYGSAYGPTSGAQLAAGSTGGFGMTSDDFSPGYGGEGGKGGAAFQLVSCGTLALSGTVTSSGGKGATGMSVLHSGGQGGGGGSGGTLLIEAASITGSGARLLAVGGDGADGGYSHRAGDWSVDGMGGTGGKGGTSSTLPEVGQPAPPPSVFYYGGQGGDGGSIGRIVINLPQGAPLPQLTADPPPSVGVVATH